MDVETIFDIDALSIAVIYCDIAATERHARHVVLAEGLPERCGTRVMATLTGLAEIIGAGVRRLGLLQAV